MNDQNTQQSIGSKSNDADAESTDSDETQDNNEVPTDGAKNGTSIKGNNAPQNKGKQTIGELARYVATTYRNK